MNSDLELALSLADVADGITLRHFLSTSLVVRTKVDLTPVSEADEEVERVLRARLAETRPDDGIVGEEFGVTGSSSRRWILDPIDGTKNYVRGIPVYATLIALAEADRGVAGVVSAPALGRRWWAAHGEGAFCNGRAIHASRIATIGESHIAFDGIPDFDRHGSTEKFLALVRRCARDRGFGDFWIHMMVAEGAIEIAVEPAVAAWDMAAVQVIVEEAGGTFTNLAGEARFDGGSGVSTNGLLHAEVLEALR
jgi:histidinol-phosphatase